MKLRKILESIIIENLEERFDLIPTKDKESMLKNLYKIAFEFGSRKMALQTAVEYVSENPKIFKDLQSDIKVSDMKSFEKFMGNLQTKARSDANKKKRKDSEEYRQAKMMDDLSNIEKMATDQNADWEKRIADMDKLR